MTVVGTIQTELIYSRPSANGPASAIVPPDRFAALDAEKNRLGCATQWWYVPDPHTGENRPAFTPLAEGRIELIEKQGIKHGERFVATINIKELTRNNTTQRQMWLVDAQSLSALITETVSSLGTPEGATLGEFQKY